MCQGLLYMYIEVLACVDILGLLEWSLEVKRNSIFNNITYASALPYAIQPCDWRKSPYEYDKEMTKTYQMSILLKKNADFIKV